MITYSYINFSLSIKLESISLERSSKVKARVKLHLTLYSLYGGMPWSRALWIFSAIRSIPENGTFLSSKRWFVISSVIELSKVSTLLLTSPLKMLSIAFA